MSRAGSAVVRALRESSGGPRLLQLAAFFSSFDRFVVAPMLVTIAAALEASLTEVAATASLYYLLYGLMQPVWGMVSDRLGRVRVMRLTLFGAAVAGVRSLVGVGFAAVLVGGGFAFMHSTLQTWATDVVPEARATVISLFAAALFAGSGLATAAAAPLAEAGSFELLFALAACVAVPLGLLASLARHRYSEHRQ
jgi:MFS family permease